MQPLITEKTKSINYLKVVLVILIGWYFLNDPSLHGQLYRGVLGNFDLLIHEAGHWIFIFFGEFMTILGGSLTQILVPLVFVIYFFLRREYYSTSILLTWVGYNIIDVSIYMADAVVMRLPLLGAVDGDTSSHDWNNLLYMTHTLQYTHLFSSIAFGIGILTLIAGLILALWFSVERGEKVVSEI
jgi:hypothetical protein